MSELTRLQLDQVAALVRERRVSPVELVSDCLAQIDRLDSRLRAFVLVDREGALAEAHRLERGAAERRILGPLHGVPVAVKDVFFTAGFRTEANSRALLGFVPEYDAAAVERLKRAGAIILGKTATAEFAYHDPAETRNPWNEEHTPGGSSSGSAAAVAARMCPAALGTQTAGSMLRPAAYCGIVGLKPSFGRISRHGLIPLAPTLDTVGVFARSVADAAVMFAVLAGHDPRDRDSLALALPDLARARSVAPTAPRLALIPDPFGDRASDEARRGLNQAVSRLEAAGAAVKEASMPESFSEVPEAFAAVMAAEAALSLREHYENRREKLGPRIREFVARGLEVPASTYAAALQLRTAFRAELEGLLLGADALVLPGAPAPAPRGLASTGDGSFNMPFSFTGHPALALPSGLSGTGLPLAIQIVAPLYAEDRLLSVARWCEEALGFDAAPPAPAAS